MKVKNVIKIIQNNLKKWRGGCDEVPKSYGQAVILSAPDFRSKCFNYTQLQQFIFFKWGIRLPVLDLKEEEERLFNDIYRSYFNNIRSSKFAAGLFRELYGLDMMVQGWDEHTGAVTLVLNTDEAQNVLLTGEAYFGNR